MKLVVCDGRIYRVRDVGPVLVELSANGAPIKAHGWRLLEDNEAREELRRLLSLNLYERRPCS
jgi:hypothetical protein